MAETIFVTFSPSPLIECFTSRYDEQTEPRTSPCLSRHIADATATAFQDIATLACSVAVLLLALSAFAKGSGAERDAGQPPPSTSGVISSRELGRAGVCGLLVFTVAEFLVFIVMAYLRNRGELLDY